MSALSERASVAAYDLMQQHAGGDELGYLLERHHTMVRLLVAESYVRGFTAGLDRAAECVRIEAEATRGELGD